MKREGRRYKLKKITVLVGNFGSGKTELALNLALRAARKGKTELIDLDMVNTYFRLSERRELIESAGIRLVSPHYVMTNVESLSLPAEVSSAFHMYWDSVIFDAGGDPAGATALGRYHEEFARVSHGCLEVLNVVNVRRPMSDTAESIATLMEDMSRNARLKITGLVNNTNLGVETGPEELRAGYEEIRRASIMTGVPVACTCGKKPLLDAFLAEGHDPAYIGRPIEMEIYTHRDWDSYVKLGT